MKPKSICILLIVVSLLFGCVPDGQIETLEGTWSCQETSTIFMKNLKGTSIYPVYIAQDIEDDNVYYIDNFYQLGDGIEVEIKISAGELTLEKQSVDGIEFEGSGTVNPSYDIVNLNYTADDGGGQIDQVTAKYTR